MYHIDLQLVKLLKIKFISDCRNEKYDEINNSLAIASRVLINNEGTCLKSFDGIDAVLTYVFWRLYDGIVDDIDLLKRDHVANVTRQHLQVVIAKVYRSQLPKTSQMSFPTSIS